MIQPAEKTEYNADLLEHIDIPLSCAVNFITFRILSVHVHVKQIFLFAFLPIIVFNLFCSVSIFRKLLTFVLSNDVVAMLLNLEKSPIKLFKELVLCSTLSRLFLFIFLKTGKFGLSILLEKCIIGIRIRIDEKKLIHEMYEGCWLKDQ